jgi:hypothetical protein
MKPTVGRIVHFYKSGLNLNGQGDGPYPAIVTQTFPGPYVNLKVLGWGRKHGTRAASPRSPRPCLRGISAIGNGLRAIDLLEAARRPKLRLPGFFCGGGGARQRSDRGSRVDKGPPDVQSLRAGPPIASIAVAGCQSVERIFR